MPSYLSSSTVKDAVDRLGLSRAQSVLADYLIFKRAIVLSNAGATSKDSHLTSVVTGTRAKNYVDAIDQLTRVESSEHSFRPYFSPFGARRDKGRGFKSKKFPSNGPSDTVSRWATRPARPLELVTGTSP